MSKIVMLPCAVKDLEDVVDYLSRFSVNAALKQYDRIVSAIDDLKQFPLMCAVYDSISLGYVYRKLVVDDYLIFYVVNDDIVEIHIKVVLCQIYKHAVLQEYYEKNLGQLVSLPYNCKYHRRNPISNETITKILSFEHRYQLYFLMLYYTGIRRGEALALQWKDVDFVRKTIRISKSLCFIDNASIIKEPKTSNGYRTVPIPAAFSEMLKHHRSAPEDFLFTQITTGKLHTHSSFKKMQNRWLTDLQRAFPNDNIGNVTSHMFRHTYITTLFEHDFPDYLVKEIVGHADAAFTKRQYYHQSKKYLENSYDKIRNIF